MPEHVPPSPDVQQAEQFATMRRRIRRARLKHEGAWYLLGLGACAAVGVTYMIQAYWLLPWITGMYAALLIHAHTTYADRVYQSAYAAGFAMGVITAAGKHEHALWHIRQGEEPCEQSQMLEAPIPHQWEHEFVREEINDTAPGVFRFGGKKDDDGEHDDGYGDAYNNRPAS